MRNKQSGIAQQLSYLGEFATAITTRIKSEGSWMFSALTLCNIPTLPFLDPSDCCQKAIESQNKFSATKLIPMEIRLKHIV